MPNEHPLLGRTSMMLRAVVASVAWFACALPVSGAPTVLSSLPTASAIPPIILQGCAQKVRARHGFLSATGGGIFGAARGDQVVGFDVSFVNTTQKVATVIVVRIGDTEFAKTGTFSPGVTIAWRLAAAPGACSIRAVRFQDGTEWTAPN